MNLNRRLFVGSLTAAVSRASTDLQVPKGELIGKTASFSSTLDLKSAADPWLVAAVTMSVAP